MAAVTYLGATTRYAIALEAGGTLVVVRQNGAGADGVPGVGEGVRLSWPRSLMQPLRSGGG